MYGASTQAPLWVDQAVDHSPSPVLAAAPEGLSARRVERWLDLPPGAWQRRRLYALRLKGEAFAALGFRLGDLVVVEPGAKEQPGSTVVMRSAKGSSLRRVPLAASASHWMPTVLELPLQDRSVPVRGHVVGTVIGLLRPTHSGALRPVPLSTSSSGNAGRARPRSLRARGESESPILGESISAESLRETLGRWQQWRALATESSSTSALIRDTDRWERMEASLATLCDCLARTHSPRLRAALSAEARILQNGMGSEMSR